MVADTSLQLAAEPPLRTAASSSTQAKSSTGGCAEPPPAHTEQSTMAAVATRRCWPSKACCALVSRVLPPPTLPWKAARAALRATKSA
jgi:hypothetical protein